jgi:hypothetical protein
MGFALLSVEKNERSILSRLTKTWCFSLLSLMKNKRSIMSQPPDAFST